jgi:serine/threonine-protein kinase
VGDASKLEGSIDAKEISLKLHGASSATLSGKADKAIVNGKATSQLRLSKLVLQEAHVDLSGVSEASIDARKRLDYKLTSLSRLNYAGAPSTVAGTKTSGATIHPQP